MTFIPGMHEWFNIQKSINIIHHINRMNREKKPQLLQLMQQKQLTKLNTILSPCLFLTFIKSPLHGVSLPSHDFGHTCMWIFRSSENHPANQEFKADKARTGFWTSALLTFAERRRFFAELDCPVHCGLFSSISGL